MKELSKVDPKFHEEDWTVSNLYAGADGWASMLRHEWHLPQFPFIFCQKLTK